MPRLNITNLPPRLQEQVSRQLHNAGQPPPIQPQVAKKPKAAIKHGQVFAQFCAAHGLPEPVAEYKFHLSRKWRFDYAWPARKIAVEVEGGIWTGGRHTRGSGYAKDMEKYNEATCCGWRVLRFTPSQLCTADTAHIIQLTFLL